MEYKDLEKINKSFSTTAIKGKEYVEVNQRVLGFRQLFPNGTIETEIVKLEEGVITVKSSAKDESGRVLATGLAQEKEGSTFINKTNFIENAETSSVGRALGFLGIGIDGSIASKEEVENAINNQQTKNEIPTKQELVKTVLKAYTQEELETLSKSKINDLQEWVARQSESTLKALMRQKIKDQARKAVAK